MADPRKYLAFLVVGLGVTWPVAAARADDYRLGPGESMTLTSDLVLQIGDTLTFSGTTDNKCVLMGGGYTISTAANWTGDFVMENCTITGLGAATPEVTVAGQAQTHKLALDVGTNGMLTVAGNEFHASGGIVLGVGETTVPRIVNNTIAEDSVVDVFQDSLFNSQPALEIVGYTNTAPKVLQGNRIFRSGIQLNGTRNWLVGGNQPGQGNVIIGPRASIDLNSADQIQVVGNYIRPAQPLDKWNQVKSLLTGGNGIVVEHNVIHGGNWNLDLGGDTEIRYNLVLDSYDRPWLLLESGDLKKVVHHNIFVRTDPLNLKNLVSGVLVLHKGGTTTAEIYNNTFHGGGKCFGKVGPAVVVERPDMGAMVGPFLDSLRSNVFAEFPINVGYPGYTAAVRGGDPVSGGTYESLSPMEPARLGYADYNLFNNPDADRQDNYALQVKGGISEGSPGFAGHDAPGDGTLDQQVPPKFTGVAQPTATDFAGRIPILFPFDDEQVKTGNTTVCQILSFYRQVFTPLPDSPLIGTGDPADGANNNIGAVGASMADPADLFASICPPDDMGMPDTSAAVFTCPVPQPTGTGGAGGGTGGMGGMTGAGGATGAGGTSGTGGKIPNPGFICVCEMSGPPSKAAAFGALLISAAVLFTRRRRAPRVRPDRMS